MSASRTYYVMMAPSNKQDRRFPPLISYQVVGITYIDYFTKLNHGMY